MQQQLETLYRSATVPIWWGPAVSCWAMFPDTAVRRDHHRVGCPVLRPGLQGREIVDRFVLQCCNRSRRSNSRQRYRAGAAGGPASTLVVRDLLRLACCWAMAMFSGTAVRRWHHLVNRSG